MMSKFKTTILYIIKFLCGPHIPLTYTANFPRTDICENTRKLPAATILLREIEPFLANTYNTNTWKSRKGRQLQGFEANLSCSVRPVSRDRKEKR